jgi:zinc protease
VNRIVSSWLRFVVLAALGGAGVSWSACVTTEEGRRGPPDPRAALANMPSPQAPPLEVVSLPSSTSPLIDLRVVFRTGSADDPPGREGLTMLSARLMREATVDLDAQALATALFPMAAELSVQVDKDATVFVGRVHKDHAAVFVPLFLDVMLRPRLESGDFQRLKSEQRSALAARLRNGADEQLQREALEAALYDPAVVLQAAAGPEATTGHPYRHTPAGTVQGLDATTLDDVRAHIARVFTADRVVVGVGGAVTEGLVQTIRRAFSGLPSSSPVRATPVVPTRGPGAKLLVVEKPAAATAISVGFALPELSRQHPDYAALKLAETWWGEHRNLIGHLFHSMRETRGLNYGDYAYVEHFVQDGWSSLEQLNIPRRTQYFSMWIRPVQHDNRAFALRMAAWELEKFARAGIPNDEEFARVQAFVRGYWRSKEQEPMRRLGYALDQKLTQMPFDRAELRDRVARLTRAEVNAAIARHLRTSQITYVVVTDHAADLVKLLVEKLPSPARYAAPMSQVVQQEDAEIVAFDLGLDADDVTVVPSAALFER